MKVLFITNIPSPYRVDFFNQLGMKVELTVLFEAEMAPGINAKWYDKSKEHFFNSIILKKGVINEKCVDWSIIRFLRSHDFDIVVMTNYAYLTESVAILWLKLNRRPYILEVDGGLIRKENIFFRNIKRLLISNAWKYLSTSRATDEFLVHYGANASQIMRYSFTSINSKEVLRKIPSPVQKEAARKRIGIYAKKIIISIGQFIPRKGFDVLLRSCSLINDDISVVIIGGKPTEQYLNIVNTEKLKNVYFVDWKTKSELADYYLAADLFVLPTREDIWGLVVNEAMAYGLPVITTDKCIAGTELVRDGENGYIFQKDNYCELAEKINLIMKSSMLRKKMSCNSLELISKYTIENMAKEHYELFTALLE